MARKYKGFIYSQDVKDYNLPSGQVEMITNGYWVAGCESRRISSYVFADGSFENCQFSRDKNGIFYLEEMS